jgi:hypothetical protein
MAPKPKSSNPAPSSNAPSTSMPMQPDCMPTPADMPKSGSPEMPQHMQDMKASGK